MGKSFLRYGGESCEFNAGTSLNDAWRANAEDLSGSPSASVIFRSGGAEVPGTTLAVQDTVYVVAIKSDTKGA